MGLAKNITVYIADDSLIVRQRLGALIREVPGVTIIGEADIEFDAIHEIGRLQPQVVILDISMPGGSGINILETIKRQEPSPLVIMLTNFSTDQYRAKCQQLGASYFFDKTTEFENVVEVLRQMADVTAPGCCVPVG